MYNLITTAVLSSMSCDQLYTELDYQTWVMNHHIEYQHTEESIVSVSIVSQLFDVYSSKCETGLKITEINVLKSDLKQMKNALVQIDKKEKSCNGN